MTFTVRATATAPPAYEVSVADNGKKILGHDTETTLAAVAGNAAGKTWNFTIENTGSGSDASSFRAGPVTAVSMMPANAFSVVDNIDTGSIDPGGTQTFRISFSPPASADAASAAFDIPIRAGTGDRLVTTWKLKLGVPVARPAIDFREDGATAALADGGTVAFGKVGHGKTATRTLVLVNNTASDLLLEHATTGDANGFALRMEADSPPAVPATTTTLAANREKRFTLSFSPADAAAVDSTQNASFTIRYRRRAASPPLVLHTVNASATVGVWPVALGFDGGTNGAVIPVTTEANFGSTPAGTPVTRTFTLTNKGDQTLVLKANGIIRLRGSDTFSAVPDAWNRALRVASGKTATFGIRFDPKGVATPVDGTPAVFTLQRVRGAGAASLLTFTVRAVATPLAGTAAIRLEIRGATAADNRVVPALNGTVSLGDVALFATGSETLVVTNTSGAGLTLKGEGDANGFSLRAMGTPAPVNGRVTLEHGATRAFRLAFTPPADSASPFGTRTAIFTIRSGTIRSGTTKSGTDDRLRSFTASARVIEPVKVAGPNRLDGASARRSGVPVDLTTAKTAGKQVYKFKIHNNAAGTPLRIGSISRETGSSAFTVATPSPANGDLAAPPGGLDLNIAFDPAARDVFTGARSDATFSIAVQAAAGDAQAWHYKLSLRLDVTGNPGKPAIRVAGPAKPDLGDAQASAHVFEFTAAAGAPESGKTFTIYSTGNAGVWIGEVRKKPDTGAVFKPGTAPGKKVLQADPSGDPDDNDKTTFVLTFDPPATIGTYEATFEIPVHRVATSTGGGEGTRGDEVSIHVLKLKATVNPGPLVVQAPAGPFAMNEDAGKGARIGGAFTATRDGNPVTPVSFTLSGDGAPYFTVNAAGEIVRSDVKILPPGDYDLKIAARTDADTSKPHRVTVTVNDNVRPKVTTTDAIALAVRAPGVRAPGVRLETDTHATGFALVGDTPAWLKLDAATGLLSVDAAMVSDGDWEKGHKVTVRASDAGGDGPSMAITVVTGVNPEHGLTVVVAVSPKPPVPEQTFGLTVSAPGGGTPASVFGDPRPFSVRAAAGRAGRVRIPRPAGLKRAILPLRVALDTLPAGFKITKVACTAGVKAGNVDLAKGSFSLSLGMANVTCAVSVLGADDAAKIIRLTEAAIDRLLDRRVDLLVGDSLDVPARFQGSGGGSGSMGPGPVGIGFTATDSRNMSFSLETSLAQLRGHAQRDAAHRAAVNAGKLSPGKSGLEVPFQTARAGGIAAPRYDIWGRVRYTTFADKVSGEGKSVDYKGTALIASLGGDVRLTEDVLVGLMGRLDRMEGKLDGPGGDADGTGWMVGPYVAARFGPERNLFAEAQGLWGQSDNKVDPLGTYRDSFRTSRWQVSGKLSGTFDLGPVRLTPAAGISWFTESQRAYVDRNGYRIGGRDISIGRLQFGPGIARDFDLGEASLTVTGGIDGIWNFARPKPRHARSLDKTGETFRGQGKLGVALGLPSGAAVGLTGRYDGIGAKNREAWGGEINVRLPLN